MTVEKNKKKPNRVGYAYSIELKCGDLDLTPYTVGLRIGNSIDGIWPQIALQLDIAAKTIVESDFYGQKTMRLDIFASGQIEEIRDRQTYFLTYTEGNVTLINAPFDDYSESDKQVINIVALCTYAVNVMGSFVNYIMDQDTDSDNLKSELTPIGILEEVLKTSKFKNYQISDKSQNTLEVKECIIPPMSLNQCIDYLDNRFLLYNVSALFKYCNKDGCLQVWNLVDIMSSESIATVNMLDIATESANSKGVDSQKEKILDEADDKKMYANGTIQSVYHSNANMLIYGHVSALVQKPLHMLYRYETYDLDDMVEDIKYHESLKCRKRYYTDTQSVSKGYLASLLGQSFKRMSRLKLRIIRNIPLETFTKVGRIVTVKMGRMIQYQKYQGKYILDSSDMVFMKAGNNWDAYCDISLFRASQEPDESEVN